MKDSTEEYQGDFLSNEKDVEVIRFDRVASARHLNLNKLLCENFDNQTDNQ